MILYGRENDTQMTALNTVNDCCVVISRYSGFWFIIISVSSLTLVFGVILDKYLLILHVVKAVCVCAYAYVCACGLFQPSIQCSQQLPLSLSHHYNDPSTTLCLHCGIFCVIYFRQIVQRSNAI